MLLVVDGDTVSIDTSDKLSMKLWTPEGEIVIAGDPHVVEFVQELILKSFTDVAKA